MFENFLTKNKNLKFYCYTIKQNVLIVGWFAILGNDERPIFDHAKCLFVYQNLKNLKTRIRFLKKSQAPIVYTRDSQQRDFTQLVVETKSLRNRVLRLQAEYTCKICMHCESNMVF